MILRLGSCTYLGTNLRGSLQQVHGSWKNFLVSSNLLKMKLQASRGETAKLSYHKKNPIKDCSWQPFKLMIVSSSFDGKIA